MTDYRITNCHLHLFTLDHVPEDFPVAIVGAIRKNPKLIRFFSNILVGPFRELGLQVEKLGRMAAVGQLKSQQQVLRSVLPQYPDDARFVVLPMDIAASGYKEAPKDIAAQHRELFELSKDPAFKDRILPFAKVNPRRADAFDEFRRCIEEYGFHGLKIYPKLGYDPRDPMLMSKVYPYCVDHNIPVMSHCSRGGVYGRGFKGKVGQDLGSPRNYERVLKEFPELRVCLAHFGGSDEWDDYIAGIDPLDAQSRSRNWVATIRDMITSGDFPNLYTDISYTMFDFEENIPFLSVFLENDKLRDRVLFGSDYYMTKQEDLSERAVSMRLRHALGGDTFRQIAHVNPTRWLTGTEPA
ncbi:amidohydrolase family protein [Shimia isoporae]|uniref:Amidohydrolase family protein n=1 Tax=Shimia isoporae TaxID=647720 RepID=A0A4R1NKA4_9RHOB|nr:amidohydrolase family protein [Shimia isoporae]TCL08737.1 amidohydrolase family protein [Shimia isoporae]